MSVVSRARDIGQMAEVRGQRSETKRTRRGTCLLEKERSRIAKHTAQHRTYLSTICCQPGVLCFAQVAAIPREIQPRIHLSIPPIRIGQLAYEMSLIPSLGPPPARSPCKAQSSHLNRRPLDRLRHLSSQRAAFRVSHSWEATKSQGQSSLVDRTAPRLCISRRLSKSEVCPI
jgi:hypothetical protein